MTEVEKQYWLKPQSVKRLRDYINLLIQNSRYLEAEYFHSKLDILKPADIESVKMGFKISVLTLNHKNVAYYHDKLFKLKKYKNDLVLLDLFYYSAVSNKKQISSHLDYIVELHPKVIH